MAESREPAGPDGAAALRAEVAFLRQLADNVPVAIAYYEASTLACRYANASYCRMFGHDATSILGRSFAEVIGPVAANAIQPAVDRLIQQGESAVYEREVPSLGGPARWIEVHLLPHRGDGEAVVGCFVLISDITRHRMAEAALRQGEERLGKFMQASAEGIVFHRHGFVTDVNPPFLALAGYSLDELMGRSTLDLVAPAERDRVAAVIRSGAEIAYDSALLHRDGTPIPVEFIVRTMRTGHDVQRMTIVRDRRERVVAEQRIRHLAHHDALTGLPNRLAFLERMQARMAAAGESGQRLALLFIDLDHFKRINDSLGHLAGDELLRSVAARISAMLRSADSVARLGGDEFLVLLGDDPDEAAVREAAARLVSAVSAPLEVAGQPLSVTPSIGVAMFPRDGQSPDQLIQHADTAMYHAKDRGRAACSFFEPAMAQAAIDALALEARLVQALREHQFEVHFQPQVCVDDGRLVGVEALLRWNEPGAGLRLPDHFLPLAEARRLMLPIGQWLLEEGLRWVSRWRAAGLLQVPLAVNLTPSQLHAESMPASVAALLEAAGAGPGWLEFELTEQALMAEGPPTRAALERLRAIGVGITVDDFGSGYTSLAHLKDLPIARLKIDRTFVQALPGDERTAAIAHAIAQLGRTLGLQVVAEGVETHAQADWLRAHGAEALQGRLIAAPASGAEFEAWLQARLRRAGPAPCAGAASPGS